MYPMPANASPRQPLSSIATNQRGRHARFGLPERLARERRAAAAYPVVPMPVSNPDEPPQGWDFTDVDAIMRNERGCVSRMFKGADA